MKKLLAVLVSRLVLFALFQAIVGLALGSWNATSRYWLLSATLTNVVSVAILRALLAREGAGLASLWRLDRARWKADLAIFSGLCLVSMPVILVPSLSISTRLWGSPEYYHQVLFQPIAPALAWTLVFAYPVTIGLAEFATYFGYVMPRLRACVKPPWLAWLLVACLFSLQHCALPLVFEAKFVFFRSVMYLPFALLISALFYRRPSLRPWLFTLNGLLNALPALTLLTRLEASAP